MDDRSRLHISGPSRDRAPLPPAEAGAASQYSAFIGRLAPGEDPARIEAILRQRHGDLERIGPLEFGREVKAAVASLRAAGEAGSAA